MKKFEKTIIIDLLIIKITVGAARVLILGEHIYPPRSLIKLLV